MRLVTTADWPAPDPNSFVARPLLDAEQSNVRIIRLAPGQALPHHTHASSDLMLYVVEGAGRIEGPDGPTEFAAGTLAHLRGDEELRVDNPGDTELILLAFLAPPFPPS